MKKQLTDWWAVVAWIAVITFNWWANSLPLGGNTTGDVSARYPNLLVPAGYAFSIWGVIYLMLGCYAFLRFFPRFRAAYRDKRLDLCYLAGSLLNIVWLLCWHNLYPVAAFAILILLALCNGYIIFIILPGYGQKTAWFVSIPFQLYFGWSSIAVLLNGVAVAVHWGADLSGNGGAWLGTVLLVCTVVFYWCILWRRYTAFAALAAAWAFAAVAVRQLGPLNGRFPQLWIAAAGGVLLLAGGAVVTLYRNRHAG